MSRIPSPAFVDEFEPVQQSRNSFSPVLTSPYKTAWERRIKSPDYDRPGWKLAKCRTRFLGMYGHRPGEVKSRRRPKNMKKKGNKFKLESTDFSTIDSDLSIRTSASMTNKSFLYQGGGKEDLSKRTITRPQTAKVIRRNKFLLSDFQSAVEEVKKKSRPTTANPRLERKSVVRIHAGRRETMTR